MNTAGLSLRAAADEAAGLAALVTPERTWTWGELAGAVERETRDLPERPRIVFEAKPTAETVIRFLTLVEAGRCAVPLPPGLPAAERSRRIDAVEQLANEQAAAAATGDEAPLALLFTSGTGGAPRAVELSRRAFAASAAASAANLGWQPDDRWLCVVPLAHIAGLSIVTRCLIARRTIVLCGRFDASRVAAAIERHRVTLVSFVPTMARQLIDPEFGWEVPSCLRAALIGGAPASDALWSAMTDRGLPALATYGMTETCSQVATAGFSAPRDLVPLPGIPVRVREGRIEVGGATLCSRIVNAGGRAASEWAEDGYFRTGDLGALGDGKLRVLGRADDVIVTGGHNVAPSGVEAVLETHEAVDRAVVFGVPDEKWGERVVAVLEARPGAGAPTNAELQAWLRDRFASNERPRDVRWVGRLPESVSGKVDRAAVRRLASEPAP